MTNLNFKIKDGLKKVDEMTQEEINDTQNVSYGFFYSIDEGCGDMFIELLEDEETKHKCYEAIHILSQLERAVEDYIEWI